MLVSNLRAIASLGDTLAEEAVKEAQKGGSGVVIYFRKEGRALGEVTKVKMSYEVLHRTAATDTLSPLEPILYIPAYPAHAVPIPHVITHTSIISATTSSPPMSHCPPQVGFF